MSLKVDRRDLPCKPDQILVLNMARQSLKEPIRLLWSWWGDSGRRVWALVGRRAGVGRCPWVGRRACVGGAVSW